MSSYLASTTMLTLRPTNLHWLTNHDDPQDLCAHSPIDFRINSSVLASPDQGDWTVTAAAIYLLRTLTQSHTREHPVTQPGEHLFPCCGHSMFALDDLDDVIITGCPNGLDFNIVRTADQITITTREGREHTITFSEWRTAVCAFSDRVRAFYDRSSPKQPASPEDAAAFNTLLSEWTRRRTAANSLT